MSLNFPSKPDIQLENPPLVEVVCQVRFPPILRIASEEPSEFQERIRDQFPNVELEHGFLVRVPGPGAMGTPTAEPQTRTYRFRTPDAQTAISLAVDFYALSSNRYSNWEEFAKYLRSTHEAIQRVYKPTYSMRIGLRYINRLTPANTGCQTVAEMFDLLRPELTCQARSEAWNEVAEMRSRLVLTDRDAKLSLGTGYGEEQGMPFFLLDFDYYEEGQLGLDNLVERCSRYNDVIYRVFRWCIPDDKLAVFKPRMKDRSK